jgi:hypothetical protein
MARQTELLDMPV